MGDGVDPRLHRLGRRGRKYGSVAPDRDALPVGLGYEAAHFRRSQVRIYLDARGAGSARQGDGHRHVGRRGHGLQPRHSPGHGPLGRLMGARIDEESRARHQCRVEYVGSGKFRQAGATGEVGQEPGVSGHVADSRDPAVEAAAQIRLSDPAIGRGSEVLVGVDESGQREFARQVDLDGPGIGPGRQGGHRENGRDPIRFDDDRHVSGRGRPGAVDHGEVFVDGGRWRRRGSGRKGHRDGARAEEAE